jgi:hypothetical protein
MLTYAHVCSRMLTYAHVCSRMMLHQKVVPPEGYTVTYLAHNARVRLSYADAKPLLPVLPLAGEAPPPSPSASAPPDAVRMVLSGALLRQHTSAYVSIRPRMHCGWCSQVRYYGAIKVRRY